MQTTPSAYHISNSGRPAPCRASVHACPRGRHFPNQEAAKFYTELHPQGEIKPVTELVPLRAATERDADNLFGGRTRAGDIYEFTLSTEPGGPRLDRDAIRNDIQAAGGPAHTVIAYDSPHRARIQLTIPEDRVALNLQEVAFDIAEVHGLLDSQREEARIEYDLTGYKSAKSARKLQRKVGTVTDVLKASEVPPAIHGPDSEVPEGYFSVTTKVMGYTRTYLAKGEPGDDEAPILGRVDNIPGHSSAAFGSGLLGGRGLIQSEQGTAGYFARMISMQAEQDAKALART